MTLSPVVNPCKSMKSNAIGMIPVTDGSGHLTVQISVVVAPTTLCRITVPLVLLDPVTDPNRTLILFLVNVLTWIVALKTPLVSSKTGSEGESADRLPVLFTKAELGALILSGGDASTHAAGLAPLS